jgi:hypothetical protein
MAVYEPVWAERYKFDYDEHHVIGATYIDLGLALSPTGNATGQYRRVGIFKDTAWFNSPPHCSRRICSNLFGELAKR